MKIGMLCGMIFPLIAIFIFLRVWKSKKEQTDLPLK
jgi:hypothetical protein